MEYTSKGAELIAKAREEDIKRGMDDNHNLQHAEDHLAMCAASYALAPLSRAKTGNAVPVIWPWNTGLFKHNPEDRKAELVKAGKFIAAQLDVLLYKEDIEAGKIELITKLVDHSETEDNE